MPRVATALWAVYLVSVSGTRGNRSQTGQLGWIGLSEGDAKTKAAQLLKFMASEHWEKPEPSR